MEALLYWGFGLFLIAALLLAIELVVPTGGVLGLMSFASAVGGCVAFWRFGMWWGIASTTSVLVIAPLAVYFALNVMPHTPLGRQLFLNDPSADDDELAADRAREASARAEAESALVGARGKVVSACRPVGAATIDGQRVEVLSLSGAIEPGQEVRVVAVEGNTVKVRAV
ncbi:MAG: NfeD family protein [Phycisphaerales bacterium]